MKREDSSQLLSPRSKDKKSFTGELYSMYYNGVAGLAKSVTNCPDNVEAWVLGKRYLAKSGTTKWANKHVGDVSYFTYRNRLPQTIGGGKTNLDHDAGWGCMIRTGQMMLSEALRRVFIQKVRIEQSGGAGATAVDEERTKRFILNMFMDLVESPFGVHAMAVEGERHAIPLGTWLTPTALCRTVRELVIRQQFISTELTVVLGLDGGISERDISDALFLGGAVLALIPIMAGMKTVGKSYEKPILKCLEMPTSVGIVGGKPQRSLFFVGHQGNDVFYLDPHVVQAAFVEDGNAGTINGPRGTCPISSIDPCMVLCFLFFSQEEFDEWDASFQEIHQMSDFPMFSLMRPKGNNKTQVQGSGSAAAKPTASNSSAPTAATEDQDDDVDDCAFDSESDNEQASPPAATSSPPAVDAKTEGNSEAAGNGKSESGTATQPPVPALPLPTAKKEEGEEQQQQQSQQDLDRGASLGSESL